MKITKIIKLIVSLTLVVCIFLPLSQCKGPVPEDFEGEPPLTNNYLYDENLISDSYDSLFSVITWIFPFLIVLLGLKLGVSIKLALLQIVAVLFAAFTWFGAIVLSGKILLAGYIAAVCIVTLFLIALVEFWWGFKKWRLTNKGK